MGLQDNEKQPLSNGWYNGYNFDTYRDCDYDSERASQVAIDDIKNSLSHYITNPKRGIRFIEGKLLSMWTEPTFESIGLGPSEYRGAKNKGFIWESLYEGDMVYILYEFLMRVEMIVVYFVLCCFGVRTLLGKKSMMQEQDESNSIESDLLIVFLLLGLVGPFLFHLFWEAKSSYVYISVFDGMIIVAFAFDYFVDLICSGKIRMIDRK